MYSVRYSGLEIVTTWWRQNGVVICGDIRLSISIMRADGVRFLPARARPWRKRGDYDENSLFLGETQKNKYCRGNKRLLYKICCFVLAVKVGQCWHKMHKHLVSRYLPHHSEFVLYDETVFSFFACGKIFLTHSELGSYRDALNCNAFMYF
jgi:hypothetical protein